LRERGGGREGGRELCLTARTRSIPPRRYAAQAEEQEQERLCFMLSPDGTVTGKCVEAVSPADDFTLQDVRLEASSGDPEWLHLNFAQVYSLDGTKTGWECEIDAATCSRMRKGVWSTLSGRAVGSVVGTFGGARVGGAAAGLAAAAAAAAAASSGGLLLPEGVPPTTQAQAAPHQPPPTETAPQTQQQQQQPTTAAPAGPPAPLRDCSLVLVESEPLLPSGQRWAGQATDLADLVSKLEAAFQMTRGTIANAQ
jgi:hypothetical protein